MTILQALVERYDRKAAAGEAPHFGFAPAKIHFVIVLDPAGKVVDVYTTPRDAKGRLMSELMAPQAPKRTVAIASGTFWDKTSYVLGRMAIDPKPGPDKQARELQRCAQEHAAFKTRHETLLSASEDAGCRALLAFLRAWTPDHYDALPHAVEMLDQNIAFRLDGDHGLIHDRLGARNAMASALAEETGETGLCLVTGQVAPIARLHPSIKGVAGAQSSGAALVSFNLDAFTSHGKTQGYNAPVSEAAAYAYTTELNDLLAAMHGRDAKGRPLWKNRLSLGDDTVVYWAQAPRAEEIMRHAFDPAPDDESERAKVERDLRLIEDGRPLTDIAPDLDPDTRIYVLGLSPNAARLSVRFWIDRSFGDLLVAFRAWWNDLRLEPEPPFRHPPLWLLLKQLAPRGEVDEGLRQLGGDVMRAILIGSPFPASLLSQALMRVRAERTAPPLRVALIKAVLVRKARRNAPDPENWEDNLVSLNREETNVGYRLGRLFSVLDQTQYAGLGRRVNAGVKDKFFGAASATPRRVFPSLLRGAQDHLSAARKKGRSGRAGRLENEMRELLGTFGGNEPFPATLSLEDQGTFVVGFYHQDAELRVPRDPGEEQENKTLELETDEQD
jgi:CRISPR-associated protein Csd1